MMDAVIVSDWDNESFHKRVMELETKGYAARQETYRIAPEVNPETGLITHLHTIEMCKATGLEAGSAGPRTDDDS